MSECSYLLLVAIFPSPRVMIPRKVKSLDCSKLAKLFHVFPPPFFSLTSKKKVPFSLLWLGYSFDPTELTQRQAGFSAKTQSVLEMPKFHSDSKHSFSLGSRVWNFPPFFFGLRQRMWVNERGKLGCSNSIFLTLFFLFSAAEQNSPISPSLFFRADSLLSFPALSKSIDELFRKKKW